MNAIGREDDRVGKLETTDSPQEHGFLGDGVVERKHFERPEEGANGPLLPKPTAPTRTSIQVTWLIAAPRSPLTYSRAALIPARASMRMQEYVAANVEELLARWAAYGGG